ncbi:MAG: hypothetical protein RMA76_44045 [Deltaproteobacteria bacterium]|jgi:hypothetical protein
MSSGLANVIRLAGGRRNHEDATTEVFAELLRNEPAALRAFAGLLRSHDVAFNVEDGVRVETQVSRPDELKGGSVRVDLLLIADAAQQSVVVEVKTLSGLSGGSGDGEQQPQRYQRTHDGLPGEVRVVVLAPFRFRGLGDIPQLTWQQVRDALERVRDESVWIDRFIGALEELNLATDMTIRGVLAVAEYRKFRTSFKQALDAAWPPLLDGPANAFSRRGKMVFADGTYDRTGYYFVVDGGVAGACAFIGMFYGDRVAKKDGPAVLYFFLETPRGSEAQKALDEHREAILADVTSLNAKSDGRTWGYRPGGYESIYCTTSLLDAVRSDQPAEAVRAFFARCFEEAAESSLLPSFLDATRSP